MTNLHTVYLTLGLRSTHSDNPPFGRRIDAYSAGGISTASIT